MACGSRRVDLHEEGVGVAIEPQVDDVQDIPAGLALLPETVAGAAVEMHLTCAERRLDGLAVHVREHQHAFCRGVLHDRRHQASAVEADAIDHAASALGRTRTPRAASASLRSNTTTSPE